MKHSGLSRAIVAIAMMLIGWLPSLAYDFEVDGIYYNKTSDNTVAVTFKGNSYDSYSDEYSGNVVIPSSVDYNGTTYSVTSIGSSAFRGCSSLTSIEIPNSVTSIGIRAFYWCVSLTSIDIPNSVTSIGYSAFAGCESLTSIKIPNSVTSIGDYAFSCCSSLTSIQIPNSVTSIGDGAFNNCSGLTSIEIPNSVTSIGNGAFGGCKSLTSIVVDAGNSIYDSRNGCNAIIETASNTLIIGCQNTIIPNSVISIGDSAFYYCKSLTSIQIPNSVTSIEDEAFYGCSSLTSIQIPNRVRSIGEWAFCGCSSLTSIEIPNSVTRIGNYAFQSCSSLTSIDIPNSVTSIGYSAFCDCLNLTSIQIPNRVTSIGGSAFSGCSKLTSIVIGNSVTSIGDYAFYNCDNLTKITCLATNPPTIGPDTFSNYSAELYVLVGCKSAYQSAFRWKNFSNIIDIPEEISFGLVGHTSAISCNPQDDYSFGISWREFAEILYNDYIPFSSVEDFKNVYDKSNLKVIYSYNGRDITQYVGASFDASLNPDNIYAWSFTFYDNIPAEVFPLNVNDATNLDIQVLCTPKANKKSYPILRVNTNLTIEPLGEYLSTMVIRNQAYWKDATTLRVLPIQKGTANPATGQVLDKCEYYFPVFQAFTEQPVVVNNALECVAWDFRFSTEQEGEYFATKAQDGINNVNSYVFANTLGEAAVIRWSNVGNVEHFVWDETSAKGHSAYITLRNGDAAKALLNQGVNANVEFVAKYPNGQVLPVQSYVLEFVKPLYIRPFEFYDSFKDGDIVGEEGSIIDISNYEFLIYDFRNQPVTKASNNGLYDYYGLEEVVWHVEEARVGITSDGVVLSKDKMLTIDGEINTAITTIIGQAATADMSLVHNGSQLIYKNTGALNVEKDFYIALYVSVKHKWGEFKAPVIIPVKVVRNINNITLDKSEAYLIVDEQISLKATVLPENATNKSVTWKSSNEAVATVDANGKVTAVSIGEAIITAMTNDGSNLSASCKVIVHANYLSGKTVNPYSGASERVSVEMTNEQAITAFQCDIYLPDGISVATIDGEYDINLSSRAKSSHSLSCVEQSDGSIRLLCYSMSLATFSGNEGELFDINFNISKEIEGNYQVLIDNIVLTDKAQNGYKSSAAIIDFNVKAYVPADVNNDGSINVTDVVATASYILGLDTKKFIFEAADMNKDGVINVTDIVGIASIILNGGSESNVLAQRCAPNSYDSIKIEEFATGKNQSQQVAIEMTNASDYSACQMDIRLPKGMSIAECELASAATDHMVAYRELPDGAVRVIVYSLTCRTLPDSEEGIIRLRTTTDNRFEGGEIVVENILFADRGQNEYRLYDSVANVNLATGVSATDMDCVVYAENQNIVIISPCDQQATISSVDGVSRTYTLNEGRNEIAAPQAGVYIVTLADQTSKVMVK